LDEFTSKKDWKITKTVLPQHTDHAGVLWHGSYLNFLEEGRIDALNKVGISYSELSKKGFEIPVISAQINYKISFKLGEKILLLSNFKFATKIRFYCKTKFFKVNGDIGAESIVELVFVKKKNDSITLVRKIPEEIENILLLLEEGP
tara:strand:+ start:195 stop:635 length:441 start_codon:yes stop_codon:yes gene_type:complete